MFMDFMRFCRSVNTIRAAADRIRMSADRLIVSKNAIRIFAMAHIIEMFSLQIFFKKASPKLFPETLGRDFTGLFLDFNRLQFWSINKRSGGRICAEHLS